MTSQQKNFTKSPAEALLAYSVLKRLGCGDITTFEKRLRSQKAQYIAQLFGVVPHYPYNLYIHGPYSPSLANDLYLIFKKNIKADTNKFMPEELENSFDKLKKFINQLDNRSLELLTTMHWLKFKVGLPLPQTLKKLSELKHPFNKELIKTRIMLNKLCRAIKP